MPIFFECHLTNITISFSSSTNPFENSSSLPTFSLGIDSSITIPIQLKDIYQQGAEYPSLQEVVTQHPRGPPGKYYNEEVTAKLVQALTAGGSSARVEVEDNHQEQFTMFRGRLEEGQLVSHSFHVLSAPSSNYQRSSLSDLREITSSRSILPPT